MPARSDQPRPRLIIPRDQAKERIATQIAKGKELPNVSINDNEESHRWYEFTTELLRQFFNTDELADEFTGRGRVSFGGGDISTSAYLKKLVSIHERLDLYPEDRPAPLEVEAESPLEVLERLINRFHNVVRQLRRRHDNRSTLEVQDEYDVQDLFHALLRIYFDDIRGEEWTPSYAGRSSRMDFLLKKEKIVIEVKKTRSSLGAAEIGEQLSIDIMKYRTHPDCQTLICFVYDPEERANNPKGLERDLSKSIDAMDVKVYISQR